MLLRSLPRASGPRLHAGTPKAQNLPLTRTFRSCSATLSSGTTTTTETATQVPSTWSSTVGRESGLVKEDGDKPGAKPISSPTLARIEKRWETMHPQEQAVLWMALRDRMKVDWHEMTRREKEVAWWISFGPHGPRAEEEPGHWWKVAGGTVIGCSAGALLFWIIHQFARPPPRTMTKEWQEATNEYLKKQKANPIYGISSEGYTGKGHVQSAPEKKS